MKSKNVTRLFAKIIAAFAAFVLLLWCVFHFTVTAHNSSMMDTISGMAISNMLTQINDGFSDMASVAAVLSGSPTIQDFLMESDIPAFYKKAETVAEIIGNTAHARIEIDDIVTITPDGSYYRFAGSASNEGLQKLAGAAVSGLPVYSTVELDGGVYFCFAMPVYQQGAYRGNPIGNIIILSNIEKIRHILAESAVLPGIDTALILGDTVVVSGRPEFDGQRVSALEAQYGSVQSSRVSGTNLYAVAAITKNALDYGERVFFIISGAALAALLVTVWFLYRALSVFTVIPLLQTADHMNTGLLRTQIDAHFVVNTIDCISKLIDAGQYGDAGSAAENLTALITHLHEAGDEPDINDEMEALTRYVEIANIRSGGKYDVEMDVDDELGSYCMPARVLQPLVENAFHHGLADMDGDCRLTVTGRLEKNGIVFEVADNGKGMEYRQIKGLQEMLDNADDWDYNEYKLKGVALLNIQKRLRARYGGGCGLTVKGRPGQGLTVVVRLPLLDKEAEKEKQELKYLTKSGGH